MPDTGYVVAAVAATVGVTVALRAIPFVARGAFRDSALLDDIGRWMPIGAVTILAAYGLAQIDLGSTSAASGPLAGVVTTVALHLRWRNLVLSIVLGTAACVLVTALVAS